MRGTRRPGIGAVGLVLLLTLPPARADEKPGVPPQGPLQPREALASLRVPKGFKVELVACEPDVVDPVAMCFDEDGRIYVCEMRGYPNAGVGTGTITSGRIKRLEDKDGDGFYETSTVWADNLRFPTGLQPWKGGLLVANAPQLLYLEDSKGEGKADKRRVLYDDFNLANIQQLVNSLQFGMDNWVHGCAGSDGGKVRSAEKPNAPAVTLRARGIRFHADVPASLEPTTGGGQYGLTPDAWGRWFTATNSQHLRHLVLPDHYLRRNPELAVPATTLDIPDHGPACKVHRISPFEAWRVERTTRRAEGPDAQRFPSTELVPGGFVTSACSPLVYVAADFPESYRGNVFVCDPANNLVHRDVLVPNGATFVAKRGDADCEFLASTDTWFRPVSLTLGPDGAIYVLDFYREVIETPLSLPDDIKKKLNLESRGRGRIWRIVAETEGKKPRPPQPRLSKATTEQLVGHLAHDNLWWRLTAQRLLIERQDAAAAPALAKLAREGKSGPARAHALWTLDGLGKLDTELVEAALKDTEPGVREQALQLSEKRLAGSERLRKAATTLAEDSDPRVRFQAAFTLGETDTPEAVAALGRIARRDAADPWTQSAVLSSVGRSAPALLAALAADADFTRNAPAARLQFLRRLAALVGAKADDAELAKALDLVTAPGREPGAWQAAVLEGLGQGTQNGPRPLSKVWANPPRALRDATARARVLFTEAAAASGDAKRTPEERAEAVRLLAHGPFEVAEGVLPELLTARTPPEVQLAAVQVLSKQPGPKSAELLLDAWPGYGPAARREVLEALFSRPERVRALLDAVEAKKVPASQLEPARVAQLKKHPDPKVRDRATALFAGQATDRQKVVEAYRPALDLNGDTARGKAVFARVCASCHQLENVGHQVGPDLLAALGNKSGEQLLNDILDPSREVDPRYLNYVVTTTDGRTFSGLIAAETATSLTLRRGEGAEDTLLRSRIEAVQATTQSVMPDGLEQQLSKQDVADVIAYLVGVVKPPK
jgi:putative membrane-bound dehydrogenase-like protein